MSLARRAVADGLGTALLLSTVVGSGIMGERLAGGNVALALLANALATGAGLLALILSLGPISGAHFNPVVTLALAAQRQHPWREVPAYLVAQIVGAVLGVWNAHLMFGEPLWQFSGAPRPGLALLWSESVATFGLLMVILCTARFRATSIASAVAAYITAAYWFTASTSFANPAVTLARALTHSFAGIAATDVPGFVASQLLGAALALLSFRWLAAGRSATEG